MRVGRSGWGIPARLLAEGDVERPGDAPARQLSLNLALVDVEIRLADEPMLVTTPRRPLMPASRSAFAIAPSRAARSPTGSAIVRVAIYTFLIYAFFLRG